MSKPVDSNIKAEGRQKNHRPPREIFLIIALILVSEK
jgi:hypothetical protein